MAITRSYARFYSFVPTIDAAVYADQSLELTHERARRENAAGTGWGDVSIPDGRYLRIPCAGLEGRQVRLLVKGFQNPMSMPDPGDSDIQAQLFVTERGLVVPD